MQRRWNFSLAKPEFLKTIRVLCLCVETLQFGRGITIDLMSQKISQAFWDM